jgi:hypothetical protein
LPCRLHEVHVCMLLPSKCCLTSCICFVNISGLLMLPCSTQRTRCPVYDTDVMTIVGCYLQPKNVFNPWKRCSLFTKSCQLSNRFFSVTVTIACTVYISHYYRLLVLNGNPPIIHCFNMLVQVDWRVRKVLSTMYQLTIIQTDRCLTAAVAPPSHRR